MTDVRQVRLKAAIRAVLDAMEERDRQAREQVQQGGDEIVTALDLGDMREFDDLDKYDDDPVRAALKLGLRDLGRIAGGTMDLEEMQYLAETVASGSGRYGRRINIIDKSWDGIRCKGALWLA